MPATPKSEMLTRAKQKSRQARLDAKARKACVEAVWKRAKRRCEYCGRLVKQHGVDEWAFWLDFGHVHEERARSLGGDPTDPIQCKLACVRCHMPNGAHRRSEPR